MHAIYKRLWLFFMISSVLLASGIASPGVLASGASSGSGSSSGSSSSSSSADTVKKVREELATPKMQKLIAETVAAAQLQHALMTPSGQALLEQAAIRALSSPDVQQELEQTLTTTMDSSQVTAAIQAVVQSSLLKLSGHKPPSG